MMRRFFGRTSSAFAASLELHTRCFQGTAALKGFTQRHIGPTAADTDKMLGTVGIKSIDELVHKTLPEDILRTQPIAPFDGLSEAEALANLRSIMSKNKYTYKSLIGQGYYESITPPVIQRCILESPGWYTPYTPYQAEIAQGRLESLLNYQTVVTELTGMPISNASLLDEATSASEAMYLAFGHHKHKRTRVFVASTCFKSSIDMVKTRAEPLGVEVVVGKLSEANLTDKNLMAVIVQTPTAEGSLEDYTEFFAKAKANGSLCICGTDLLACTLATPPSKMGADVVYGSAQRFGIPLGFGGPHAAFFTVRDELKRIMPGRLIGVTRDAQGNRAIRMALQTREQHIRREKATSNICTAQALLANMSAMYAIYHGPEGLTAIAQDIHAKAKAVALAAESAGHTVLHSRFFDTVTIQINEKTGQSVRSFVNAANERQINVFANEAAGTISIAVDEATRDQHLEQLFACMGLKDSNVPTLVGLAAKRTETQWPDALVRKEKFMTQSVFHSYRSETDLMRYIYKLQRKDYGLVHGMIPLGSCTMKLNPASTMLPLSWPEVGNMHPLVGESQARGYNAMATELKNLLKEVTGFADVSLQPNSGAQGEYAGLRVIKAYHDSRGESHRNICIIPRSAHGTNPASAALCGMQIVVVECEEDGSISLKDLEKRCIENSKNLSCAMITYPSTYGVFDTNIRQLTKIIHDHGGQVYIDGANMNALVGLSGPKFVGGDVCHLNLHKTFSIPHGGGGPGMGPIGVADHLAPFLPNSAFFPASGGSKAFGCVSQAPLGSASILTISYMLIKMLGAEGMKKCTEYSILSANYLRCRLQEHYPILFKGANGFCAHEFIIDLRPFEKTADVKAEDVAKRLMDYGFHAPTLAFPVPGTLMIEPTESEPLSSLDAFADAMIQIRREIRDIEEGRADRNNNLLKNAPHTQQLVLSDKWDKPYSREQAAFPTQRTRDDKFWPTVARVDGVYGDRNLMCSCAGLEHWEEFSKNK